MHAKSVGKKVNLFLERLKRGYVVKQAAVGATCVAWFKLADVIARGEKERALVIYRLFSHSLRDNALCTQLQGDLLWEFQDRRCLKFYEQAAKLSADSGDYVQEIVLYEIMNAIDPLSYPIANKLLKLSLASQIEWRVLSALKKFLTVIVCNVMVDEMNALVANDNLPLELKLRALEYCVDTYSNHTNPAVRRMIEEYSMFSNRNLMNLGQTEYTTLLAE